MARVFSLAVLGLVAASAVAQGPTFGRFGYVSEAALPGWRMNQVGFQATAAGAANFTFPSKTAEWQPVETSPMRQTLRLGKATPGMPDRAILHLDAPGFSLRFSDGFEFAVDSQDSPFLSWSAGSVADGVPTPMAIWILVSFRSAQPPVLLSFWGGEASLLVEGSAGAWRIRSAEPFKGWVWVLQPLGGLPTPVSGAADLGRLVGLAKQHETIWSMPPPSLVERKIESDDQSVTATWRYDRPGALVPVAALMASLGGDPCRVLSEHKRLSGPSEEGPLAIATVPEIRIRFPARRIPPGRFLASEPEGTPEWIAPADAGFESVVTSALGLLSARASDKALRDGELELSRYLRTVRNTIEPWTRMRLPYDAKGEGLESLAAHALLLEALRIAQPVSEFNPLMSHAVRRLDWHSWQPWGVAANERRRASAVLALAGAFSSLPVRRLEAAMLQAGLSAERSIEHWRMQRAGVFGQPKLLEPLEAARKLLYSLEAPIPEELFASVLFSPLRSDNRRSLRLVLEDGTPTLSWWNYDGLPGSLALFAPGAMRLGGLSPNLQSAVLTKSDGLTVLQFRPADAGLCGSALIWPVGSPPIPALPAQPSYSESLR